MGGRADIERQRPARTDRLAILRRFLTLYVPLLMLVGLVLGALYYNEVETDNRVLRSELRNHVELQTGMLASHFRAVLGDLQILSRARPLRRWLDEGGRSGREEVVQAFGVFIAEKPIYDRLRFVDESGRQLAGVALTERLTAMPLEAGPLDSEADRRCVEQAMRLDRGRVYTSRFDLAMRNGRIEQPMKPTIRFATPVFDSSGRKRGAIVLNYLGKGLLQRFARLGRDVPGRVMLLDHEGYWLYAGQPRDEWGFVHEERRDRTMAADWPQIWQAMTSMAAGQRLTEDGLFTFHTVWPLREHGLLRQTPGGPTPVEVSRSPGPGYEMLIANDLVWQIVSFVPSEVLAARLSELRGGLLRLFALLAVVGALGAWFLARMRVDMERADEALRHAERLAAIGEAMTGLAHESRNALQRSQACLEMLGRRVRDRPEALELIRRIQNAQSDLHHLYETVRGYAAPIRLERRRCDLRCLLRETWEQVASERRPDRAELREHADGVDTTCRVDAFAIRQCLRNILENALNEEHDASVSRDRVEVEAAWSDDRLNGRPALSICISDNGPGLTAEQARRVFEPFYTTRSRGTGLGLAITRRIIEAHGGRIAVGPGSDRGARIMITLPRNAS